MKRLTNDEEGGSPSSKLAKVMLNQQSRQHLNHHLQHQSEQQCQQGRGNHRNNNNNNVISGDPQQKKVDKATSAHSPEAEALQEERANDSGENSQHLHTAIVNPSSRAALPRGLDQAPCKRQTHNLDQLKERNTIRGDDQNAGESSGVVETHGIHARKRSSGSNDCGGVTRTEVKIEQNTASTDKNSPVARRRALEAVDSGTGSSGLTTRVDMRMTNTKEAKDIVEGAESVSEDPTLARGEPQQRSQSAAVSTQVQSSESSSGDGGETRMRTLSDRTVKDEKHRSQDSEGSDSLRRTKDSPHSTYASLCERMKLLPINCPEKLVFVVDCGAESGLPCGQFVDGSPATIMDALKKAIRMVAHRRAAVNPSAQIGLVEWGRTPRWRLQLRSTAQVNAALEIALDKLAPSAASEDLCDFNTLLHSIKEGTGLHGTWDGGAPPFVVRAIIFYSRHTPPACSKNVASRAPEASHCQLEHPSISDRVIASSVSAAASITNHPLFALDAVFVLEREACRKPETTSAPVTSMETEVIERDHDEAASSTQTSQDAQPMSGVEDNMVNEKLEEEQQTKSPSGDQSVSADGNGGGGPMGNVRLQAVQRAQTVFSWLCSLGTPSSYILPCAPSPLQILQQCCRLFGHPLQRPPQHLAYRNRHRPTPADGQLNQAQNMSVEAPVEQTPEPAGHVEMTVGDCESSTESSSTLSRLEDEPIAETMT